MRALLGTLDSTSRAASYMMGALAVGLAVAVLMTAVILIVLIIARQFFMAGAARLG